MLREYENIYEYEDILMGKKKNFICSFKGTAKENAIEVGNVWRYAITKLLKWTPEDAVNYLTDDIVKQLSLDKTLIGINFNMANDFTGDYKFVLQYAFPKEIRYSLKEQSIDEYQHVSKIGRWANDKDFYRFQKKFFTDIDGVDRANIILNYAVSLYLGDMFEAGNYSLYNFFDNNRKAMDWLRKKHLDSPIGIIYTTPLDYFHNAIKKSEKNDLYYYSLLLNKEYQKHKKKKEKNEN